MYSKKEVKSESKDEVELELLDEVSEIEVESKKRELEKAELLRKERVSSSTPNIDDIDEENVKKVHYNRKIKEKKNKLAIKITETEKKLARLNREYTTQSKLGKPKGFWTDFFEYMRPNDGSKMAMAGTVGFVIMGLLIASGVGIGAAIGVGFVIFAFSPAIISLGASAFSFLKKTFIKTRIKSCEKKLEKLKVIEKIEKAKGGLDQFFDKKEKKILESSVSASIPTRKSASVLIQKIALDFGVKNFLKKSKEYRKILKKLGDNILLLKNEVNARVTEGKLTSQDAKGIKNNINNSFNNGNLTELIRKLEEKDFNTLSFKKSLINLRKATEQLKDAEEKLEEKSKKIRVSLLKHNKKNIAEKVEKGVLFVKKIEGEYITSEKANLSNILR